MVNFENYIDKRINMAYENIFNHKEKTILKSNILNANIHISYPINNMSLESTYKAEIYLEQEGNKFYLPDIYYGIYLDKCYVYAIQNKKKNEENIFVKKINRLLYKINANVEDTYEEESIKDVTVSHILSLTIFLNELEKKGINKLEVVPYLPIRYENKIITEKVLSEKIENKKERELLLKRLEEEREKRQINITNKFVRNFFRINYIFEDTIITNFPGENGLNLNLKINLGKCNNPFLKEVLNYENNNKVK